MENISHDSLYIIGILSLLYSVACVVVRLTPSPKDDRIVSWIGRIINLIFRKANIKDADLDDLKSKATAIALDEIKHNLRELDKTGLFEKALEIGAHKALVIKDDESLKGMKIRLGSDMEMKLIAAIEGRVMHTWLGKRLQKKLLRRKLS